MKNQRRQNDPDYVYGKNPVFELIRASKRRVKEILLSGTQKKWQDDTLFHLIQTKNIPCGFYESDRLDAMTQRAPHQGVVARVSEYPEERFEDVFYEGGDDERLVLILDSLQDPQNFGTVCRSALSFGVKEVIVTKDRSVPVSATVCKASAGAVEHLKIVRVTNLVQTMKKLKDLGFWLYGASLEKESLDLNAIQPSKKAAIVLGSEGKGLRRLIALTCDQLLKIPMRGDFDSLNVAQAGTVILYEFMKKIYG